MDHGQGEQSGKALDEPSGKEWIPYALWRNNCQSQNIFRGQETMI